jgi:iron complex outermembrane receptor protein
MEMYYSALNYLPNPSLKPETMRTIQGVWEQGLGTHAWLTVLAFHNDMDDLITQEAVGQGSLIFRNLQDASSSGVQVELKARLSGGLEGDASYSYQRTSDDTTGGRLNNSPGSLFKVKLSQPLLHQRLFASADAQYTSHMQAFTGAKVPPFAVVNFTMLARNLGKHVDLSASVYNLLNRTYFDSASDFTSLNLIQQDGRSFRVNMTWHLGNR